MDLFSDSDESLMHRFQTGEEEAFEALFSKYTSPLINFAYRFLGSRAEAEDVAQEAFLRVYRNKDRYDPSRPFRPWLFSIAARLALNESRNHKRHGMTPLDSSVSNDEDIPLSDVLADSKSPSPEAIEAQRELTRMVQRALAALPENQRAVVLLCRFEQMSYEEIGKTMDLSLSAVKSLLFRARQTLAQALAPYERQPDETAQT